MKGTLPIDWSRYTLKADIVAREVASLRPFEFSSFTMPPPAPDDFAILLDSVQANGVCEPLTVTPDGEVVDGHARLRAALDTGIHQVPTRILESHDGEQGYALWTAVVNVGRRHLTPAQRLGLVQAVLGLLEECACASQAASRFGRDRSGIGGPGAPASPNLNPPGARADVRARVGALMGVSRSQAAKMVNLVRYGSDDLREAVTSGRTSIHRAHEVLRGRASRPCAAEGHEPHAILRRQLTADPVRTLRAFAGQIPDLIDGSSRWTAVRRREFLAALQDVMDSCELTFRRLGHGEPAREAT